MMTASKRKKETLSVELRDDGVAVMTFDVPGERQNTLKAEFGEEFEAKIAELDQNSSVKAMVFISGKPDSFLAGADIGMLQSAGGAAEVSQLSQKGQEGFNKLSQLRFPVVAAIHGPCLGGGLELALACTSRVCSDDRRTQLAAPEVQLGLLPGAGGTQRLPRLVGIATALDMMLTGRKIRPSKAKKMGLVDDVVPKAILLDVAIKKAKSLAGKSAPKSSSPAGIFSNILKDLTNSKRMQELALEENPLGRKVLFQQARKTLMGKTYGNYPAPERIIDAVEIGQTEGFEAGLRAEARMFGALSATPEAKQLMGIFDAMTALKKDTGVDDSKVRAREITQVGMLGAGLMGAGIAYVSSAMAGKKVRLKDIDDAAVARGLKTVKGVFDGRVKRKSLDRREADRQFARVTGTVDYSGFQKCDIVIEAVLESLELKHRVIREVESVCGPETIFASNTSSLPITSLAEASSRPETVIGMHYFSPVEKMPLLEIIVTEKTADWVTASCVALGKKQGKTVIVVKDGVGFYTSRILAPYMNEAARVMTEGVKIESIDRAIKQWGFPVGPVTLMDEVGLDVAAKVGPIMVEAFGSRMEPPAVMEKLVQDGRAGRKNKKGFYVYEGKKKVDESVYGLLGITPNRSMDPVKLAERCALQMINEAMLCYGEGILRSPRDGDIGAIFGLGFPPFLGGPFRYVDTVGAQKVIDKLQALAATHGPRFTPAPVLVEMASSGKKFYF